MNVYNMNVNDMINSFSAVMCGAVAEGAVGTFPATMLWGPPGVGKSQGVYQLAKRVGERTGLRTVVTDVRLLLFNPVDLRGLPVANADKTLAVWLRPKIFQMDASPDVINFLFLDEISAAPLSVQAAAYQIALDKTVGEHRLPANCFVIAAGNRLTDKSVAFKMPKALANRLCHVEIFGDFDSFKMWAIARGIDMRILGFLSNFPAYLMDDDMGGENVAFPTPRSWEAVDKFLKMSSGDINDAFPFICGSVGMNIAVEFRSWCTTSYNIPSVEDIFAGRAVDVPQATNQLYALISTMVDKARKCQHNPLAIDYSLEYALRMPADYAYSVLRDYMAISDKLKKQVAENSRVKTWIVSHKRYLNG